MERIKEEIKENVITLWNVAENIAIQFNKQDFLARYNHAILVNDLSIFSTEIGMKHAEAVAVQLVNYGAEKYPENFVTIK